MLEGVTFQYGIKAVITDNIPALVADLLSETLDLFLVE